MAEEPDNLFLAFLRRLDAKMDRLAEDMQEVKTRLGTIELLYASVSRRVDRIEEQLDRVESGGAVWWRAEQWVRARLAPRSPPAASRRERQSDAPGRGPMSDEMPP